MNDPTHDDYSNLLRNYLQNEPSRYFGDLDYLRSQTKDGTIEKLVKQVRRTSNLDDQFIQVSNLFSQIITEEMAQYDDNLKESYQFQQDVMIVFFNLCRKSIEEGDTKQKAEQKAAKILWNSIQSNRLQKVMNVFIRNRLPTLTPSRESELLKRFNVTDNLVKLVQRNIIPPGRSYEQSAYDLISNHISKAIDLFLSENYDDMIVSFNIASEMINEFEGREANARFAFTVGSLLKQKGATLSEGLRFLDLSRALYEQLGDEIHLADCYTEISNAYWRQGKYKDTLNNLAFEIDLRTKQKNNYAVMISEEKLCHFFRNLSRFNESQEWALRHLNSTIRAADDQMKGLFFLDANLNYAETLLGLNQWLKAEKHINFAERAINHLEVSDEYKQRLILEINRMKGYISVFRGQFDQAKTFFDKRKEFSQQIEPNSPVFNRFLRAEATLYRNLRDFSQAIQTIQPLFQNKDSLNPLNVVLLAELLALHAHESQALKLLNRAEKVFLKWNSIHCLSRIYLSVAYIHLLMQDFPKAQNWYRKAVEITKTDLPDLNISISANLNLAYIELEKGNYKLAENHCTRAEEYAMMSGSKSFILDSNLLRANLWINAGNDTAGVNTLKRISKEAEQHDIWFILQKANYRLNEL
ncbi:MAG: tetratricopeptide repeat protein [Candidatus Thorarchaeota archaeon]